MLPRLLKTIVIVVVIAVVMMGVGSCKGVIYGVNDVRVVGWVTITSEGNVCVCENYLLRKYIQIHFKPTWINVNDGGQIRSCVNSVIRGAGGRSVI